MADRIYIRTGDMPTGSLKKGKNKVDDVVSTLLPLTHQRGNPLDSIYYVMNGEYHRLFSNGAATLVANCCAEMQNLQLQIETYLAILNSGPGEFEQIDRAAKNSLTTWTDRTGYAIGGAFSPITSFIGGTFSYLFLPRGLTGFFMTLPSSSGQKQKNEQESTTQNSSERTLPGWAPGAGVLTIHPQREVHEGDVCKRPEDWSERENTTGKTADADSRGDGLKNVPGQEQIGGFCTSSAMVTLLRRYQYIIGKEPNISFNDIRTTLGSKEISENNWTDVTFKYAGNEDIPGNLR